MSISSLQLNSISKIPPCALRFYNKTGMIDGYILMIRLRAAPTVICEMQMDAENSLITLVSFFQDFSGLKESNQAAINPRIFCETSYIDDRFSREYQNKCGNSNQHCRNFADQGPHL